MNIFLTGATGFLGGELLALLSKKKDVKKIFCLVRASNIDEANYRLSKVFNLHGDYFDKEKIFPVIGDLAEPGISELLRKNTALNQVNYIVHSAANTSFGKNFDDLVERVNVLGLNEIIWWSKTLPKLETFVYVGTATISGKDTANRLIYEEESPNLKSKHFVKYTYTKMLGEILLRENLDENKLLIVRPSIIMGDTRPWIPRSYVILWALAALNLMRLVPVNPDAPLDIISVDFAAAAIIELLFVKRNHTVYHISAGVDSQTSTALCTNTISSAFPDKPPFAFVPRETISQMKLWAKNKLPLDNELYKFKKQLAYWDKVFADKSQLRILFAGLDPYIEFIELGQVFDNTKLFADLKIAKPIPAHMYLKTSMKYLKNIDVMEGALDP